MNSAHLDINRMSTPLSQSKFFLHVGRDSRNILHGERSRASEIARDTHDTGLPLNQAHFILCPRASVLPCVLNRRCISCASVDKATGRNVMAFVEFLWSRYRIVSH